MFHEALHVKSDIVLLVEPTHWSTLWPVVKWPLLWLCNGGCLGRRGGVTPSLWITWWPECKRTRYAVRYAYLFILWMEVLCGRRGRGYCALTCVIDHLFIWWAHHRAAALWEEICFCEIQINTKCSYTEVVWSLKKWFRELNRWGLRAKNI